MILSVVILTWNCAKEIQETLVILANDLVGLLHEVIVVDNGSTDGCSNYATIANEVNRGVSIGKNQGIDAALGDYIVILDGDIVPVPNSINRLLLYIQETRGVDAIGFLPNRFTSQRNTSGQKNHETFCREIVDVKEHTNSIAYYGIFRRSVFEKVRFDEAGPLGLPGYAWEERDLYEQMKAVGIMQHSAEINHKGGRYYHNINSSVRIMGDEEYRKTSHERHQYFKEKWGYAR